MTNLDKFKNKLKEMIDFTEKLEKLFGSWDSISDMFGSDVEMTMKDLIDEINKILIYNE